MKIGAALVLLGAALVGCREAESITTVDVVRSGPKPKAVDVEGERKLLDHMVAAIVPQGDKAWFFKMMAKGEAIEPLRKSFDEFLATVQLEPGKRPSWKLPAGWSEQPGNENREATLVAKAGDHTAEVTVMSLPLAEAWDEYVERNVTRWLGQLDQPPLPAEKVKELAQEAPIAGGKATVIELVGVMQQTPGMGGMPAGHPPIGRGAANSAVTAGAPRTPSTPPPAATAPIGSAPASGGAFTGSREFTFQQPREWKSGPMAPMRKAAFVVEQGGRQAEMTVTSVAADGPMSDATAQAQRWAGQIGLKLSDAELKAAATAVKVDGATGQQFELLGPEINGAAKGTLAAMVAHGDQMWFFKLSGDRKVVESQREAFAQFLASVKFTAQGH